MSFSNEENGEDHGRGRLGRNNQEFRFGQEVKMPIRFQGKISMTESMGQQHKHKWASSATVYVNDKDQKSHNQETFQSS